MEDDVTMCNYMAFLKKNWYISGSIRQVYTVLNCEPMIRSNLPLKRHMKLKLIMKRYTKGYVSKKAFVLNRLEVARLIDGNDLLNDNNVQQL